MKPHSHEERKRHTFDSFCKKVLKNEARDYYDDVNILNTQQLDAMSQINIDQIDRSSLVDITSVHIDTSLPAIQRMKDYLEQVKNPYCFLCGDTAVRIRFEPNGTDLSRLLKNYFVGLKRRLTQCLFSLFRYKCPPAKIVLHF